MLRMKSHRQTLQKESDLELNLVSSHCDPRYHNLALDKM